MSWLGAATTSDAFEVVVGILLANAAKKAGVAAVPLIGAAVAIDGFIDVGIQIAKAKQMYNAAKAGKAAFCKCPRATAGFVLARDAPAADRRKGHVLHNSSSTQRPTNY